MKRKLYYILPFMITPGLLFCCELLDDSGFLRVTPFFLASLLIFCSLVIGNLTPTGRRFDFLIAVLMPGSLFLVMFFAGLFDQAYAGFDFRHGWNVASQDVLLVLYPILMLSTLFASYKTFRLRYLLKK